MTAAYHSLQRTHRESRARETQEEASEGLQSHSCGRDALGFRDAAAALVQVYSGPEGLSTRAGDVCGGSQGVEG